MSKKKKAKGEALWRIVQVHDYHNHPAAKGWYQIGKTVDIYN